MFSTCNKLIILCCNRKIKNRVIKKEKKTSIDVDTLRGTLIKNVSKRHAH